MGVIVTGRDYKNRYRPEIVDWLIGNVGDWQTLTIRGKFAIEKAVTDNKPLMLESNGYDLVLGDGTAWSSYGFDNGDVIHIKYRITKYNDSGGVLAGYPMDLDVIRTINVLQGDRATITQALFSDLQMLPFRDNKSKIDNIVIYADKKPQGIELKYNHTTNGEVDTVSLNSFIDGNETRFLARYTDTLTGWQNCETIGMQSGMSVKGVRWIFEQKEGTHTYIYKLEIEFMLHSFFEELSNFETMTAPSQVFNGESVTDNFELIGYPEWNNPNTMIKSDKNATKRLGNTGWFNENFNGLQNEYTVKSVTYYDVQSNTPTQRLSYGGETKVKAVIGGVQNLANGLTKLGIGFIFLPEREDLYKDRESPYQQNLLINTAGGIDTGVFTPTNNPTPNNYEGFTSQSHIRMDVKDVRFAIDGNDLIYEAIFSPTAGFTNFIDNLDEADKNYAIWISTADRTEITNFADRVSLLLDYNKMELFVPPVGEWQPMSIGFVEHPFEADENIRDKAECGDFRIEDDILAVVDFNVDITQSIPTKIDFVIEVENAVSGVKYELQKYGIDLTGFPNDVAGVPQWDFNQTRGFKLEDGNNKNWVKVRREPNNDVGNSKAYKGFYAFKIRWEDWIARTGVPSDFFNLNAENNGFNNDWFQYLGVNGWTMNFTVYTHALLNGEMVRYTNEKPLIFKDYDENENIEREWSILREIDGTPLPMTIDATTGKPLGVLLESEQVRLRCKYTKLGGNFGSLDRYYGTLCIEVDRGGGQFEFRQLSTVWGSENGNPLIPLTGETRTKITALSPNEILLECLVEPSNLENALRYKLSSRLGCYY